MLKLCLKVDNYKFNVHRKGHFYAISHSPLFQLSDFLSKTFTSVSAKQVTLLTTTHSWNPLSYTFSQLKLRWFFERDQSTCLVYIPKYFSVHFCDSSDTFTNSVASSLFYDSWRSACVSQFSNGLPFIK